jgi:hypothetical protein
LANSSCTERYADNSFAVPLLIALGIGSTENLKLDTFIVPRIGIEVAEQSVIVERHAGQDVDPQKNLISGAFAVLGCSRGPRPYYMPALTAFCLCGSSISTIPADTTQELVDAFWKFSMIVVKNIIIQRISVLLCALSTAAIAQQPPYDVFPAADAPYYRVRYEASTRSGDLCFPVNYTIWIPREAKTLRGVIVHQHGCGEGSCKSGLTGAYDLHWQALARRHDCALLAPAYEQPEMADCQMWCDPRNGSDAAFQRCLTDLGTKSAHPELATVPWALWGHSGGGHWAGGMVLLHPDRVAAAWLRSGVPLLKPNAKRPSIKAHSLSDAALQVPLMCNLGTKEGVTVKEGRFAGVWPANEAFFGELRGKRGLIGVAIDPLTSHECGNQRYLAIPWLDACLAARLPEDSGRRLRPMPASGAWLAEITAQEAVPAERFMGDSMKAAWLPNEAVARRWMQYVKDTAVVDLSSPPAPKNLRLSGNELRWDCEADLESGLAGFIIERDGEVIADLAEKAKNPYGRPIFQNLQYSDTPTQPLVPMQFTDMNVEPGKKHSYRLFAVNTMGLKSDSIESASP